MFYSISYIYNRLGPKNAKNEKKTQTIVKRKRRKWVFHGSPILAIHPVTRSHRKKLFWIVLHIETDRHRNSMTEFSQWDNSVKTNFFYWLENYCKRYGFLQFAGNYCNNKKYASTNWLSRYYEAMKVRVISFNFWKTQSFWGPAR